MYMYIMTTCRLMSQLPLAPSDRHVKMSGVSTCTFITFYALGGGGGGGGVGLTDKYKRLRVHLIFFISMRIKEQK